MNSLLKDWAAARRALADHAATQVVGIDRGRGVRFSGILWDHDTVVTAAELLDGADTVAVHTANEARPADILASDLSVDVAVLKIRTGNPGLAATAAATAAVSASAAPANTTIVAGTTDAAPSAPTPSPGDDLLIAGHSGEGPAWLWTQVVEVGPAWRSRSGGELDRLIRLAPGLPRTLEGAAAVDLDGRLYAMAVRGPRHQTLGIPRENIERIVAKVRQHGRLPQPYLGVRLQPVRLDETLRQACGRPGGDGVIIVGVEPESPAAGSLLFGDLILDVAGQPVATAMDLKSALNRQSLGSPLPIQVYRAGSRVETTVTLHERARP